MKNPVSTIIAALLGLALTVGAQDQNANQNTDNPADGPAAGEAGFAPLDQQRRQRQANEDGYWIKDAALNEILQFLASEAGLQYFHNSAIEGPAFMVTGHLNDGDPEKQMEELAFQFGLELYKRGSTIYALNAAQVNQLPQEEFAYQLRYLRPSDINQIQDIITPLLTPGTGSVNFEPKTNTLLVLDSAKRIAQVTDLLGKIDQPKGQLIIETKILRVTSSAGSEIGVDWSSILGGDGLPINAAQSLNALFNLPEIDTATEVLTRNSLFGESAAAGIDPLTGAPVFPFSLTPSPPGGGGGASFNPITGTVAGAAGSVYGYSGSNNGPSAFNENSSLFTQTFNKARVQGSGLVLSPLELQAVLYALNTGNLAKQQSNPTLITEDNEQATISIIDRVPIITATVNETTAGITVTEEVRYRIDEDDPVNDPVNTREVGVTVAVTPTLLPDNTVRMALRPRTAQIVEFIQGRSAIEGIAGNQYPRVAEATVETLARVPNGYSLLIGGFYQESETDGDTKVPVLGDIPLLNFFFKSDKTLKTQTSLVFVITPTSYQPEGAVETLNVTEQLMNRLDIKEDYDSVNPNAPGPAHKADMRRTMNAILFDAFGPQEGGAPEAPPAAARGTDANYRPLPPPPTSGAGKESATSATIPPPPASATSTGSANRGPTPLFR